MKEITREELAELVNRVSAEVSEIYTDVQDTGHGCLIVSLLILCEEF